MLETIVGVFVGVLLGSTVGAYLAYKITRALIVREKGVRDLLKKIGMG